MTQLAAPSRPIRSTRGRVTRPARPTARSSNSVSARRTAVRSGAARVEAVGAGRRSHSGFMWLVAAIAFVSAMSLLMLNTMRAEQSFTLNRLQSQVTALGDQKQALQSEISAMSAPEALAVKADSLGMVVAPSTKYIRRSDGKVLGVATSGTPGQALNVNTLPDTAANRAAADILAAGSVGNHIVDPAAKAKADAAAKASKAAKPAK